MTVPKLARTVWLIAALAAAGARAEPVEETLDDAGFGKLAVYLSLIHI